MSQLEVSTLSHGAKDSLTVRDLLRRKGMQLESPDNNLSMDDALLTGEFLDVELRRGLSLHVSNAREERAFTATSSIRDGLSCIFFFEGSVDIKIGDRAFEFRGRRRGSREGAVIASAHPDSFQRRSHGAQSLQHLVISATSEWLNLEALRDTRNENSLVRLLKDHLANHRWALTPRVTELIRQILAPSTFTPELRNLYLESRAVEIVGETLAAVVNSERRDAGHDLLAQQDVIRLERAKDFIAANLATSLNVELIAREAGLNASGLQQLFRLSENTSIFEYVRRLRLERAYASLRLGEATVAEASLIAGYSSSTNFATAFRRQFGLSPREALSRH